MEKEPEPFRAAVSSAMDFDGVRENMRFLQHKDEEKSTDVPYPFRLGKEPCYTIIRYRPEKLFELRKSKQKMLPVIPASITGNIVI